MRDNDGNKARGNQPLQKHATELFPVALIDLLCSLVSNHNPSKGASKV